MSDIRIDRQFPRHSEERYYPLKVLQHYFNSLHLFCRLRSIGVSKRSAIRFCRAWERIIHPYLYRRELGKKTI